jgi:hypothetical protein
MYRETQVLEQNEHSKPRRSSSKRTAEARETERVWEWIRQAATVCESVKAGNLEARILGYSEDDDLGRLVNAINDMLDITDAVVRESRAALEFASQGKFFRRVILRGLPGSFRSAAQVINSGTEDMQKAAGALDDARIRRRVRGNCAWNRYYCGLSVN